MSDSIFENLPSDNPEQAFLILEKHFRDQCDGLVRHADEHEDTSVYFADYMANVLAAVRALELTPDFDTEVPTYQSVNHAIYLNFRKDVKHYCTMLQILHGRRIQGYSVRFDAATKIKVRHHLTQLRDVFDKLEVETRKKEALFAKLNALEQEVDRDRTRYDAYAALTIEASGVMGQAVERSGVLKILDALARVIWNAKTEEQTAKLPAPTPPKRLPAPKPKLRPKQQDFTADPDDEIPF